MAAGEITIRPVLVLALVLLAPAVQPYQQTRLEDVMGEYDFRMFRTLFANTTRKLLTAVQRLETDAAKEASVSDLKDAVSEAVEDLETLQENTLAVRDSVDNGADATKVEMRAFKDEVLAELSDVRALVADKSAAVEAQVAKLSSKSVNLWAADCQDLYDAGFNASGVYFLQKFGRQVLCDMETGGGGWLVIQRRARVQEQVDFNKDWYAYKAGFGDPETEFWIGNDFLHVLTNQKAYQLLIDIHDYEKGDYWASYSTFRVGSEASNYTLDLGDYSGNATDAFTYHHDRPFTSLDRDNDLYQDGNCAVYFSGGWWYDRCYDAHLNGVFPVTPDRQNASYITWWAHENGQRVPLVLNQVTLRVKPRPL